VPSGLNSRLLTNWRWPLKVNISLLSPRPRSSRSCRGWRGQPAAVRAEGDVRDTVVVSLQDEAFGMAQSVPVMPLETAQVLLASLRPVTVDEVTHASHVAIVPRSLDHIHVGDVQCPPQLLPA